MCDERTERENEAYLQRSGVLSRRTFAGAAGATALSMMLASPANAETIESGDVSVTTPDGEADCYFASPASGKHPGVLVWPDIRGLRPAFKAMGDRLAKSGYSVLVVNPFYRTARAPIMKEGQDFRSPEAREILGPARAAMTNEAVVRDAKAFAAFLDAHPSVDVSRKLGTTGYCMGGPLVMRTAAALPDRIGAAATFHGGGLATDADDSPHLLIPDMKASFLIAIAENDDEKEPEAKGVLRAAFDTADLPAEIEVYEGAMHGWCPPDSAVYNEAQAERAWSRLLALFETSLA